MNVFSWLKRFFKIGEAQTNSLLDKLENPIKMTEQGIRDLKADYAKALEALTVVNGAIVRLRNDLDNSRKAAGSYEEKAMRLLEKARSGAVSGDEADRLAYEALKSKESIENGLSAKEQQIVFHEKQQGSLRQTIEKLKSTIEKAEKDLYSLRARAEVARVTKNVNKQLAQIDPSGTIAMMERMKDQVAQDEAMAVAYAETAQLGESLEAKIDRVLKNSSSDGTMASLLALKAKLGIEHKS